MAGDCVVEGLDMKEMGEEELWELINDNRHLISLNVRPCMLTPYLRQARVLSEMDEDEIFSSPRLPNRSMKTSYMLDLLQTQGRNGAVALLESVMIHYPIIYTKITGRRPSTEPSGFSGLIKYSELTEYLVRAMTGMQKELQAAHQEASKRSARCASLELELSRVMSEGEGLRRLQAEYDCTRRQLAAAHSEIAKLKDEKCDLYARYTAAIEEKSAENIRRRDLNLQVYQLQTELHKAQSETNFQRQRSLRCASPVETQQLREEVMTLRRRLLEAEKFTPAREDILAQDLAEAMDGRTELAEQLRIYREENGRLLLQKEEFREQKEELSLQVQQMTLDCSIYQQKMTVIQRQLRELQAERDQAYLSRDEAQAQITRSLVDKDALRSHVMELQERVFTLQATRAQRARSESSEGPKLSWTDSPGSSSEDPSSSSPPRSRLRRMNAINPSSVSSLEWDDTCLNSVRSSYAEPPGPESLRRRERTLYTEDNVEIPEDDSLLDDYVFLQSECEAPSSPRLPSTNDNNSDGLSRTAAPPFLVRSRPQAIRIAGRVLTISFQAEQLLDQLTVVGGNKTGVFIHQVKQGSAAHDVGISPGTQIVEVKYEQEQQTLRMVLEDSTLEEAMWALGQAQGFCHLTLRPCPDAYEKLLQQLKDREVMSGDSFYVRVNMSITGGPGGVLPVPCNSILHVTNTRPNGAEGTWCASHVHSCQLLDLQAGKVPNYYRAQRLLIRAIEDMSFKSKSSPKGERVVAQEKMKAVRIVSTGRQGGNPLWVSVKDSKTGSTGQGDSGPGAPRGCVTLMPYTLVRPHFPPVCRPVLLLPTILGRILDKKLAQWQGFQLCQPEVLASSEHAARLQRSEVLEDSEQGEHRCYTLQSVEKVMKQGIHCVLPLGLDCVRRLHRAEIFPIIIFIAQSKSSAHKLRTKLQRHGCTEEQLLACSRSQEPLLDKLPCLYRRLEPEAWCDSSTLLTSLRGLIWEEQKKVVWVETDGWKSRTEEESRIQ